MSLDLRKMASSDWRIRPVPMASGEEGEVRTTLAPRGPKEVTSEVTEEPMARGLEVEEEEDEDEEDNEEEEERIWQREELERPRNARRRGSIAGGDRREEERGARKNRQRRSERTMN